MIDHLAIEVSNLTRSGRFYREALAPLGYKQLMDKPKEFGGRLVLGWADEKKTDLYISEGMTKQARLHIAFRADNREQVNKFFSAAIAAGGKDNGKPGLRSQYHENYYAAFVLDPDGQNIEAVCHEPQTDP